MEGESLCPHCKGNYSNTGKGSYRLLSSSKRSLPTN